MSSALPVSHNELAPSFQNFPSHERVLLAVSGGRDSLALVVLACQWCDWAREHGFPYPKLYAVTVDHGLRADAADEAQHATTVCSALGVSHSTISVDEAPPNSGLQAWARSARYATLVAAARNLQCSAIATGHQADDQAETLLMRLARGSGLDGLSAMSARGERDGIDLLRPLLELPRERLTATLVARNITWCDDPSNVDPRFERSTYVTFASALEALGLGAIPVGRSARRLQDARDALEWMIEQTLNDMPGCRASLRRGYARVPEANFHGMPRALRCRLLSRLISSVSGDATPPRLERLENLADRLSAPDHNGEAVLSQTLGGCLVVRDAAGVSIFREPGRRGFPVLTLQAGQSGIWDRRFEVAVPTTADGAVEVRAFCDAPVCDRSELASMDTSPIPARARAALPTFWQGHALLAVPHLGFARPPQQVCEIAAEPPDRVPNSTFVDHLSGFSAISVACGALFPASTVTE